MFADICTRSCAYGGGWRPMPGVEHSGTVNAPWKRKTLLLIRRIRYSQKQKGKRVIQETGSVLGFYPNSRGDCVLSPSAGV